MDNIIQIRFSEPNQFGEVGTNLQIPLDIDASVIYLHLQVNDNPSAKYHFYYKDAGTVGHASMQGNYAVNGRLSNVSIDWKNPKPSDFGIINVNGVINRGIAKLYLWCKVQ